MAKNEEELEDDDGNLVKTKLIIKGEDYQLKQVDASPTLWDLYLLRKKKDGTPIMKIEGYGLSLSRAMMIINNYQIAKRANGMALTMKQYLQLYQRLLKRLVQELHGL